MRESKGEPGVEAGRGFLQDVDLTFDGACVTGMPLLLPAAIADGEFCDARGRSSGVVGLPLLAGGAVILRLVTVHNGKLCVGAANAQSSLLREENLLDNFGGNTNA
jgi:hypothetical protein